MQIFSGSSNPELAQKIAELSGSRLGEVEISQFANGETRVWIKEKIEKEVIVVQSLSTPTNEHLMEFCLLCDAIHRGGATEITAVIPWMGYSKQDKVFRPGEPLSAKVVAQIIQTARVNKIITVDLHNRATLGFFDVPIVELSAKSLLLEYFRQLIAHSSWHMEDIAVVAPDSGSVKASTAVAMELGLPIVYMDKKRDLVSGKVEIVGMSGSVKAKNVVMFDDNVFTGSTLIETSKELKKAGAEKIYAGLTHHLYIPGVQEKLEASEIDEIVVMDTVCEMCANKQMYTNVHKWGKLKVLSVAGMIVDELR